jgi:DNA-binding transcriptional LysR family regulator
MSINASPKQLRAFVAVARLGGFSRAAPRLFLTQSAVTTAVRELEAGLGAPLFDRTTRSVELTRFGADFLPVAERLLQDFDAAMEHAHLAAKGERGILRIAAGLSMITTFLPQVLVAFAEQYPHVQVHLRDDNGDGINHRVERSDAELGLSGKFGDNPELVFEPLFEDRFGAVCHRDYPLARAKAVTWRDLAHHRYIASSSDTTVHAALARSVGDSAFFRQPLYEASSLTTLESLLEAKLGFSVLTALAASHNPQRNLVYIPLVKPMVKRQVCLISREGRHLSPPAAAFRAQLLAVVRRLPATPGIRLLGR